MAGEPLTSMCLSGGDWLDLDRRVIERRDVVIEQGRVTDGDGSGLPQVDVSGCLVSPGLIDMHVHAFEGTLHRPSPDDIGWRRSATTVADGGSVGWTTFDLFRDRIDASRTRLFCWLNLSSIGILDNRIPELLLAPLVDPGGAAECAIRNRDHIVGLKARLSTYACGGNALHVLDRLLEAGRQADLPVMIHVGETLVPLPEIVARLRPGDVVTHCYTRARNNIFDPATGRVHDEIHPPRARGVLFDIGRGGSVHFAPETARAALEDGFPPDIISSDVADRTALDPTFGVLSTIATMVDSGMDEIEAFRAATVAPANAIGRPELVDPAAAPGGSDLSIIERPTSQAGWRRYAPRAVVVGGRYFS
ncbi:MAG: amidohydrolase family protein [Chloroflexota bacterium]